MLLYIILLSTKCYYCCTVQYIDAIVVDQPQAKRDEKWTIRGDSFHKLPATQHESCSSWCKFLHDLGKLSRHHKANSRTDLNAVIFARLLHTVFIV